MPVAVSSPSRLAVPTVELMLYHEDENYLVNNEPEPRGRSQALKVRSHDHVWWVRVSFMGTVHQFKKQGDCKKKKKSERRKEFQEFVKSVDYCSFPLLNDTVTEIVLVFSQEPMNLIKIQHTSLIDSNIFIDHVEHLDYRIHENPTRVIYLPCSEFPSFRKVDVSNILVETEIADGRVFQVRLEGKEYIYKTINRPFYEPMDTEVIRKELENLEHVRNLPNIVQQAGVVVSTNPYMTSRRSDQPLVITGILLEFYGGGSLQHILDEHRLKECDWPRWALQIGTALDRLHNIGRTHMDIKPSNIVVDLDGNAILIDISGMSVTQSWLAPEMKDEESPIDKPFRKRLLNDTWAYGKLLFEMAMQIDGNPFTAQLRCIGEKLMQKEPHLRMSLAEAIIQLHQAGL